MRQCGQACEVDRWGTHEEEWQESSGGEREEATGGVRKDIERKRVIQSEKERIKELQGEKASVGG
jgi:hypothetical protein